MTRTAHATQQGMPLTEACALAVGMLGDNASTSGVFRFLRLDGWDVSLSSVRSTLFHLRGAAVEVSVQGVQGYGRPTRWRPTEAARAWVMEDERCGA